MHDKNGKPLNVGDNVLILAVITSLTGGTDACNGNFTVCGPERGPSEYTPQLAMNTKLCVRNRDKSFTVHEKTEESLTADELAFNEIIANKTLRKGLDAQLQDLKSLPPSRERSLAITKIQEAVMWLGMDLKRLNDLQPADAKAPNPYPNSYNPGNAIVEPTADGLRL